MLKNTKSRMMAMVALALTLVLGLGVLGSASVAKADDGEQAKVGKGRLVMHLARDLMDATLKGTKLTRADIVKGYRDGLTLKQQIEKAGGNAAAIQAAAKSLATAQIDEAVSNGKVTKDQADKLRAKIDPALDKLLNTLPKRFNKSK